jgi:hypothetical protein
MIYVLSKHLMDIEKNKEFLAEKITFDKIVWL